MISAQDIANRKFDKALHGYKPEDVDEFMSLLELAFEKLWKEHAELRNKMGILVDKIQEYREVEASLRNALLSAQKMSEDITAEAKRQGDIIVADAREKADRIINQISIQILSEKRKLEEVKRETQIFKGRLLSLYRSQITMLETIPGIDFKEFSGESAENNEAEAANVSEEK